MLQSVQQKSGVTVEPRNRLTDYNLSIFLWGCNSHSIPLDGVNAAICCLSTANLTLHEEVRRPCDVGRFKVRNDVVLADSFPSLLKKDFRLCRFLAKGTLISGDIGIFRFVIGQPNVHWKLKSTFRNVII